MLTIGKAEVAEMVATLQADHDSVEAAARAALSTAETLLERRTKYTIAGQLARAAGGRRLEPSDPAAVKIALGLYSTEGAAVKAAESLWSSTISGDEWRAWVLPVHHGTPADLHAARREKHAQEAARRAEKARERLAVSIRRREEDARQRAAGGPGACQCGHEAWWHMAEGSSRGRCAALKCTCVKWNERKK